MRIRGWKQLSDGGSYTKSLFWRNRYTDADVGVSSFYGMWEVYPRRDGSPVFIKKVKTKERAYNIAIAWMKRHPRG